MKQDDQIIPLPVVERFRSIKRQKEKEMKIRFILDENLN